MKTTFEKIKAAREKYTTMLEGYFCVVRNKDHFFLFHLLKFSGACILSINGNVVGEENKPVVL